MNYLEYLQKGEQLINYFFSKNILAYQNSNYNNQEGRVNSVNAEKVLLDRVANQSFLKNLSQNVLNSDKDFSNGNYWYDYYKYTGNDFGQSEIYIVLPKVEQTRHWFDASIVYNGFFYPINIKITEGNTTDNLFGLMALNYLIFGVEFYGGCGVQNTNKVVNEANFSKQIYQEMTIGNRAGLQLYNIRDYFFLTIKKSDGTTSVHSLLNIDNELIKTNPKNLFQADLLNIPKGINLNKTNFENNIIYCIDKYYEYVYKKAMPYIELSKLYINN